MDIPSISDDVLQCIIYPLNDDDSAVLLTQIMAFVKSLVPNHIWHRDSFEVTLSKESKNALECTMRVGDSIDNEWLVVYLLWQVTKQFPVAASVQDADGQFLLIEAADKLPSWVTPENVENRVWIYQGHLHIVPLLCSSKTDAGRETRSRLNAPDTDYIQETSEEVPYITTHDALTAVQNPKVETQVSEEVEALILVRISGYPDAAKSQIHRTKVALPTDISRALARNPNLIQKAVECFYTRDALQLRATQKMTRFPPSSSSLVTVRMTRTAYAQLMGQRFNAPRIFRRPLNQTADEERWWDNGVKIACGFEMLYQEARVRKEGLQVNGSEQMDNAKIEALLRDPGFVNYIARLEYADYFEGEMRDSEKWKEKERQAAKMWIKMRQADDASRPSFAELVKEALNTQPQVDLKDEGEDSDNWLHIEPMELERSLNRYDRTDGQEMDIGDTKEEGGTTEDQLASEQARRLKTLADKMEGFVEGEGVMEGAVFEDDILSDDGDDDDEDLDSEDERVKRKIAMDALVAPLGPGEYGKMPIEYRHPNSQLTQPDQATEETSTETKEISKVQLKSETPSRPIRKPIFQRDKFDGVDSDDETSEEDDGGGGGGFIEDEESGDDQPQVVGEVEIDMEQEQEDFLRFSREMLGIDDEAWANIISDRQKRGVYIPPEMAPITSNDKPQGKERSTRHPSGPSAARFFDEIPKIAVTTRPQRSTTTKSTEPNEDLNSFDAVMEAMEKELERLKVPRPSANGTPPVLTRNGTSDRKGKGKAKQEQVVNDGMDEDDEEEEEDEFMELQQAMDLELKSALKRDTKVVSSDEEGEESEEEVPMDYNLIKNFLESFKSQQGLSGPVGGLVGRLQGSDWALPRDG